MTELFNDQVFSLAENQVKTMLETRLEQVIKLVHAQMQSSVGKPFTDLGSVLNSLYVLEDMMVRVWLRPVHHHREVDRRLQALASLVDDLLISGTRVIETSEQLKPRGFFVYGLFREDFDLPVYVGKSTNWPQRMASHESDKGKKWDFFRLVQVESKIAMEELESQLINHYRPEYNKDIPKPPCADHRYGWGKWGQRDKAAA